MIARMPQTFQGVAIGAFAGDHNHVRLEGGDLCFVKCRRLRDLYGPCQIKPLYDKS